MDLAQLYIISAQKVSQTSSESVDCISQRNVCMQIVKTVVKVD